MSVHDFDAEQKKRQKEIDDEYGEHSFVLRGETFSVRRNFPYMALREVAAIEADSSDNDAFTAIEGAVLAMLGGGDEARSRFLRVLRESYDFPVTYNDMLEIHNWMLREATSRPPTQPSASSDSSSSNGTSSTGISSPEPAEASTT